MKNGSESITLTPRQFEIAQLLCTGLSNDQIGKHLFISKRTVEACSQEVYKKLNVTNRTALISQLVQGAMIKEASGEKPYFFRLSLAHLSQIEPSRPKTSIYNPGILKKKKTTHHQRHFLLEGSNYLHLVDTIKISTLKRY